MTRISSVYKMGPDEEPAPDVKRKRADDAKRQAWHKHGLLMIDPEDINDDWERQVAINLGNKHYGRRAGYGE